MTVEQKAVLISLLMDYKMGHTDMDSVINYIILVVERKWEKQIDKKTT